MWTYFLCVISATFLVGHIESGCRFPEHLQGYWVHNTARERLLYNITEESLLLSETDDPTKIINEQECDMGGFQEDNDLYLAYRGKEDTDVKCAKLQPQDNVLFLWDSYELNIDKITAELVSTNVTRCSSRSVTDLVFVMDSSGSICSNSERIGNACENWQQMLNFTSEIVESLEVGPNASRVGFVSFGSSAYDEFFLNEYMDKQAIQTAIQNVPYRDENTNIAAGIEKMHKEHFIPERGDRADIQNIAIVITDGQSRVDVGQTIQNARDARADGIRIFAVGVTSDIDEDELRGISSPPQEINSNYFLAANFTLLSSILDSLVQETCVSAGGEIKKCLTSTLDVVIAIDTADILNDTEWEAVTTFTKDITEEISAVSFPPVKLGILLYSTDVYYASDLEQFETTEKLLLDLERQDYRTGSRSTSSVFRMMNMDVFNQASGDRDYAPDVVIMVTHGTSNMDANRTLHEAFLLRSNDVHVYTVAVTSSVNVYEVKYMSSYPHMKDVTYWEVNQFADLTDVTLPLMDQICKDFSFAEIPSVTPQICSLAEYAGSPKLLNKYPVLETKRCIFANNSAYKMTIRTTNQQLCVETQNSRAVVFDDILYLESCDNQWELQNEMFWCIDDTESGANETSVNQEQVQYFFKPAAGIGHYYCSKYTDDGTKTSLSLHINDQGSLACSEEEPVDDLIEGQQRSYTIDLVAEIPQPIVGPPNTVFSISPKEGPTSGGTSVVISGNFGDERGSVFLVNSAMRLVLTITSWTSTLIIGVTRSSMGVLGAFRVAVAGPGQPVIVSAVTFTYEPDPVVLEVFPRTTVVEGGTNLTVIGKHFDGVAKAVLYINMERRSLTGDGEDYEVLQITTFSSDVSYRVNDTMIIFITPAITLPDDYLQLTTRRQKRQAREDNSRPVNDQYLGFDADVELDGILAKEILDREEEPITLSVLDPYFVAYDEVRKFDSEKEIYIEIQGGNLTLSIGLEAYQVTLGMERCEVNELLDNTLTCLPPREEPLPDDSIQTPRKDLPQLQVRIGYAVFHIGYVDYVRKTEMTYFIVGLVVLATAVIAMLVFWAVTEKMNKNIADKFKD